MSLADAEPLDGAPFPADGQRSLRCADLSAYAERKFILPAGHPDLLSIHDGGAATDPALDNLVGMRRWWFEHPDWMDFLSPDNPGHDDKLTERELYLDHWRDHLPAGARVMDLGGGIGRFTQWCLDHGCEVELVDPDLRSLWAAVKHAGGRPGRLDVHWTTASGCRLSPRRCGDRCGGPLRRIQRLSLRPSACSVAACSSRASRLGMGGRWVPMSRRAAWTRSSAMASFMWTKTGEFAPSTRMTFEGCSQTSGSVTLRRATMC